MFSQVNSNRVSKDGLAYGYWIRKDCNCEGNYKIIEKEKYSHQELLYGIMANDRCHHVLHDSSSIIMHVHSKKGSKLSVPDGKWIYYDSDITNQNRKLKQISYFNEGHLEKSECYDENYYDYEIIQHFDTNSSLWVKDYIFEKSNVVIKRKYLNLKYEMSNKASIYPDAKISFSKCEFFFRIII